ncbi:MAG: hypothetical protein BWY63_01354 [Chloroflexi bacterium ADurb.Bin360]|nr:MAG: hypothetical protein BWY63_01354 [Chloroflexi bacterium ADurb.Bin360]
MQDAGIAPLHLPGDEVGAPDEVGDEARSRMAVDFHGRTDLLDDALVHHDHAV